MRSYGAFLAFLLAIMILAPAGELLAWDNPYIVDRVVYPDGRIAVAISVPGLPPAVKVKAVEVPAPDRTKAINSLSSVPAFDWSYGCSATSAAMAAGYYDNHGYLNMYSGPANGGTCPMNNSVWGYGECPLSATHQGVDGRATRGHVDDYWISYGSGGPDPFVLNGWTEHTHGDCTGDYMGTSQWACGNTDGSTAFWYWGDGAPYSEAEPCDGGDGVRRFYESRGYTVLSHFSQQIVEQGLLYGFSFAQFTAEIDAGRPVLIHIEGHTMLGFGYDSASQTIYIHDTWDHNNHTMTWAGDYPSGSGNHHYAVTVVVLEDAADIFQDGFESGDTTAWSSWVP